MRRPASSPGEAAAPTDSGAERSARRAPAAGRSAPPAGLYIHIPFCVSLCPYCDFVVVAGAAARGPTNRIAVFAAALETEIGLRADALDARFGPPGTSRRPLLRSVYFGGGTPSLVPAETIARLLGVVRERFGVHPDAEITIEANPGPDERGDPVALVRAGVTRISFGAQSLDRTELRRLGRRHRPGDIADAVADARDAGIHSINLDLLFDVPDSTLPLWIETVEGALAMGPDHLSLYALTLDDPDAEGLTGPDGDHLPTTRGARQWREFARPGQDEDRAAAQYHHAVHRLAGDGWRGYEISNWARPGHESRHNLAYWERKPYEAVGPGAHAFDGATRRWTIARVDRYLDALTPRAGHDAALPPGGSETIDAATAALEVVILGLRTDRGLPRTAAEEPPLADEFGWALAAELVTIDARNRIVLTTRGRLLSNELFGRLV
ncbi:MAG TPA: coproporphyrinogen-III oxidase family protein [Candidatus Limnocylindrales bacterium]|nr:coproporphyrinogen-III oxidase family protein [Candidatus Limnocylindrales bacterium]